MQATIKHKAAQLDLPADSSQGSYKIYVALITQDNESGPTVKKLLNTLGGDIVWTRTAQGRYQGVLAGAFTADKTYLMISNRYMGFTIINRVDVNTINVSFNSNTASFADSGLLDNSLEIRVYN